MQLIGARLHDGVELPAGGVSKFRLKQVLQNGEFLHGIVGHVNQRTGNGFVVVVDAFHGKVVVARTHASDRRSFADSDATAGGDARGEQ